MELLKGAGYDVVEDNLTRYDIIESDEAFLTGTAAEIIPMVGLDGRKIGDGKPGQITKQLMGLFREHTKTGVPFD